MVWVIAFGELFFGDLWCVVWGYGGMRTHFWGCGRSVSSCLCVGLDFLEVLVESVGVGHGHLVDGLFPPGNLSAFNEPAS